MIISASILWQKMRHIYQLSPHSLSLEFKVRIPDNHRAETSSRAFDAVVNLALVGRHQSHNAAVAATAACYLKGDGFPKISALSIANGVQEISLPGRFQARITCSPSFSFLITPDFGGPRRDTVPQVAKLASAPEQQPWVILDGAHTPESGLSFAKTLRRAFPEQPLALIVAGADDKDWHGFMRGLQSAKPDIVIFTTVSIANSRRRYGPVTHGRSQD